jgi:hypothetical protein
MTTHTCIICGKPYELPEGKKPDKEHRKRCYDCMVEYILNNCDGMERVTE